MRHNRRWISLLCLLALALTLAGCGSRPVGIMDDGADRFAQGKETDDYSIRNSGDLLDELIDKYSGSFYTPSDTQLSDDEYQQQQQDGQQGDDQSGGQQPQPQPQLPIVRNHDELAELLYQAYAQPSTELRFIAAEGYDPRLHEQIGFLSYLIERRDPIIGTGVESWSWWTSGEEYYIQINYSFALDELSRMRAAANARVHEVAARLDQPGLSEYEKVVALNEYLCDTVYYPPNEPYPAVTHSVYGALVDGCAVCEGYACATLAILREMNVNIDMIFGPCNDGGYHAWNIVMVDGNWYQMDVTWNDGSNVRDLYLLVTDDYMRQSRSWDYGMFPPTPPYPYTP